MKFEQGKYYKTRGGDKVSYIGQSPLGLLVWERVFPIGLFRTLECGATVEDQICDEDIIGEWKEVVKCAVAVKGDEICLLKARNLDDEISMFKEQGYEVKEVTFGE